MNPSNVPSSKPKYDKLAFPSKLHAILHDFEQAKKEDIISWADHGKSFKIHDPDAFSDQAMPKYFNGTKFNSFRRQLQLYGFRFVKDRNSPDHGSYCHPFFIKGQKDLCSQMTRQKIKGNNKKLKTGRGGAPADLMKLKTKQAAALNDSSITQIIGNKSLHEEELAKQIGLFPSMQAIPQVSSSTMMVDQWRRLKDILPSPVPNVVASSTSSSSNNNNNDSIKSDWMGQGRTIVSAAEENDKRRVSFSMAELTLPLDVFSQMYLNSANESTTESSLPSLILKDEETPLVDDLDFFGGRSFFSIEE